MLIFNYLYFSDVYTRNVREILYSQVYEILVYLCSSPQSTFASFTIILSVSVDVFRSPAPGDSFWLVFLCRCICVYEWTRQCLNSVFCSVLFFKSAEIFQVCINIDADPSLCIREHEALITVRLGFPIFFFFNHFPMANAEN